MTNAGRKVLLCYFMPAVSLGTFKANSLMSLKTRSVKQVLKMLLVLFHLHLLLMYAVLQVYLSFANKFNYSVW